MVLYNIIFKTQLWLLASRTKFLNMTKNNIADNIDVFETV